MLGEAIPREFPPGQGGGAGARAGAAAGAPATKQLVAMDLPAGAYVLVVSGAPTRWEMRVAPPGTSTDGGPDGTPRFVRGDCNGDGQASGQTTDAVFLLQFNFLGGTEPASLAACDANGDGQVRGQTTDAVYMLLHNFLGGPPPPAPFPECGPGESPRDRELGCRVSARCP